MSNNTYYYTFKLHSRSLLVNTLEFKILNVRQLWCCFRRILLIIGWRCPKKLLDADYVTTSKRVKITK